MASAPLPSPTAFVDLNLTSPDVEDFPKYLLDRPGAKKSYLGTICRNKFRIITGLVCFLAMVGGSIAAGILIGRGMQRINQGQAALAATLSSPTSTMTTPLESTVTKTVMVTQTSGVTSHITISVSRLQSTVHVIATSGSAPAPIMTCTAGEVGVTCANWA